MRFIKESLTMEKTCKLGIDKKVGVLQIEKWNGGGLANEECGRKKNKNNP